MGKGGDTVQNQQTITHVNTSSSFNPSLIIGSSSPVQAEGAGRDSVTDLLQLGGTPTGPDDNTPANVSGPTLTPATVLLMVAAGLVFYVKR